MAFHPFHYFRKHQKVILAGITIIAMITFVLSGSLTGRGDFFGYVTDLVGGEGRSPKVATLYGSKVDQRSIDLVRVRRQVANLYVLGAVVQAHNNILRRVEESLAKWDAGIQQPVRDALFGLQLARQFGMVEGLDQSLRTLTFVRNTLAEQKKSDEVKLLGQFIQVLEWHRDRANRPPGDDMYFGGTIANLQGVLDFLIWKHKADELGIVLTPDDVIRLIKQETLNQLDRDSDRVVTQNALRSAQIIRMTETDLIDALTDEYRVRLAQASILGEVPSADNWAPVPITPHEFYDYFKTNRTEVSVALLPFPVKNFVDQVSDKPTEEELQKLFEKYKDVEYAPDSPTPGFKVPRKVGVEWVAAKADSPYFKKRSEDVLLGLTAAIAANPWPAVALSVDLLNEYERSEKYRAPLPPWNDPSLGLYFDTRPEAVAVLWSSWLGGAAANAPGVLKGLAGFQATQAVRADKTSLSPAARAEYRKRLAAGITQLLAGLEPVPLSYFGLWHYGNREPQYLPQEALHRVLVDKARDKLAVELVAAALNTVRSELEARKAKPEEARKYVAEAVKRYDLQTGATTQPRDRYDIATDPQLAALKDAYLKNQFQDPRGKEFYRLFFTTAKPYEGLRWPAFSLNPDDPGGQDWSDKKEPFLFWKTSDKPAYVPTLAEVKDQVEAAWKFDKARALARRAAEETAQQASSSDKDAAVVLAGGAPKSGALFTVDAVSRLKPRPNVRLGARTYERYQIPDKELEFPKPNFVDEFLQLSDRKATKVLSDRPEATYYVAAQITRREPTIEEFYTVYRNATPEALQHDTLLEWMERDRRSLYRRATLEQLRAEAKITITEFGRKMFEDRGTADL